MELLLHDTNILHKTNTSCYLAKEEAPLQVIRLIVVKSAVKVSLALPQPIWCEPQAGPSAGSRAPEAPGHGLQTGGRVVGQDQQTNG